MNINHNGGGESKRARGNRPQKYTGTERVHCLTFSVSTNKKSHCIPNSSHCHQTAHKNRHAQKINSTLYTAAFSLKKKKKKKKTRSKLPHILDNLNHQGDIFFIYLYQNTKFQLTWSAPTRVKSIQTWTYNCTRWPSSQLSECAHMYSTWGAEPCFGKQLRQYH